MRVDAAKIIIDRAGYVAAPPDASRDPAEARLANEAKDVSPPGAAGEDETSPEPAASAGP